MTEQERKVAKGKITLQSIKAFLLLCTIFYAAFGFIASEFNPMKWNIVARIVYVIIFLFYYYATIEASSKGIEELDD